jgi:hypothetical protein
MNKAEEAVSGRLDASGLQDRRKKFKQFNRLLWLCWVGLLLWSGILFWRHAIAVPAALASAAPEAAKCLRLLPDPARMSLIGKALYTSLFAFEISFLFIVLGLLHRMVHKFASGRIFVSDTLTGLKSLGLLITAWPFIHSAGRYGFEAALRAHQDLPPYWPLPFNVNFGIVAVGLFLLAIKAVIENAIDIKTDHELTI